MAYRGINPEEVDGQPSSAVTVDSPSLTGWRVFLLALCWIGICIAGGEVAWPYWTTWYDGRVEVQYQAAVRGGDFDAAEQYASRAYRGGLLDPHPDLVRKAELDMRALPEAWQPVLVRSLTEAAQAELREADRAYRAARLIEQHGCAYAPALLEILVERPVQPYVRDITEQVSEACPGS